ncbi:hypothetical protein ABCS02_28055 [Microbacterium sp. X-17]|uniref:hypothetical protein n=1 Tax=Microbacterium sp. X-17 TaxID=3144404 RepID=UPI0031F5CFDD
MLQTVLTAAIAATVAFLLSVLNEILRERRAFRHRWDREVRELASDYLAATRRLMHLVGSTAKLSADATELVDALQEVRMRCSQLLLLADPKLAEASVRLQSEAYAVVQAKLARTTPSEAPNSLSGLYEAVREFVLKARAQLALPRIAGVQRAAYEHADQMPE